MERRELTEGDMAIVMKWIFLADRMRKLTFGACTGQIKVYGIDSVFLGVVKEVKGEHIFVKA